MLLLLLCSDNVATSVYYCNRHIGIRAKQQEIKCVKINSTTKYIT